MVKLTRKEVDWIIASGAAADFLTEGKYTGKVSRLVKSAVKKGVPLVGRALLRATPGVGAAVGRGAVTTGMVGRTVAMRHPYLATAAVLYVGWRERDKIAALAEEGWEVVEPYAQDIYDVAEPTGVYDIQPGARQPGFLESTREKFFEVAKRPKSKYNKAVSAGMKAVKASAKGGKKGTISNPKTTFKTVAKVASKISKGVKVSPVGISGIAAKAARKVYGKIKKSKKKTKKRGATYTYRK